MQVVSPGADVALHIQLPLQLRLHPTDGDLFSAFPSRPSAFQGVDLFSKDYIFVPIHGYLHWSLVLICHPGNIVRKKPYKAPLPAGEELEREEQAEQEEQGIGTPALLHFDSLDGACVLVESVGRCGSACVDTVLLRSTLLVEDLGRAEPPSVQGCPALSPRSSAALSRTPQQCGHVALQAHTPRISTGRLFAPTFSTSGKSGPGTTASPTACRAAGPRAGRRQWPRAWCQRRPRSIGLPRTCCGASLSAAACPSRCVRACVLLTCILVCACVS